MCLVLVGGIRVSIGGMRPSLICCFSTNGNDPRIREQRLDVACSSAPSLKDSDVEILLDDIVQRVTTLLLRWTPVSRQKSVGYMAEACNPASSTWRSPRCHRGAACACPSGSRRAGGRVRRSHRWAWDFVQRLCQYHAPPSAAGPAASCGRRSACRRRRSAREKPVVRRQVAFDPEMRRQPRPH